MSDEPDPRTALVARLDTLISEFVAIHGQLLKGFQPAPAAQDTPPAGKPLTLVQDKLSALFQRPLTNIANDKPLAYKLVAPGVKFGFHKMMDVTVRSRPRPSAGSSPDRINQLQISCRGESRWFSIEVLSDWAEIEEATRFQIGLYGRCKSTLRCTCALRFPKSTSGYQNIPIAVITLAPGQRNTGKSGELQLPANLKRDGNIDLNSVPILLFYFTFESEELELLLDYITAYFC